ncbi:uncharacterized protein LOC144925247 isoform X2 [Branchiostoma floridae x Branchiostoma belcheri]
MCSSPSPKIGGKFDRESFRSSHRLRSYLTAIVVIFRSVIDQRLYNFDVESFFFELKPSGQLYFGEFLKLSQSQRDRQDRTGLNRKGQLLFHEFSNQATKIMDLINLKTPFKTPATDPTLDLNSSNERLDDDQEVPSSPQGNRPSSPDLADLGLPASPTGTCTVTEDRLEERSQKLDNGKEKEFQDLEKSRISDQKTGKVSSSLSQEEWDVLFTAVLSKPPEDSSAAKKVDSVEVASADDFESLAVEAKQVVVEGEGSESLKAKHGETGEHDAKDVPDKTPATSEHNTPKCHTPKKPAKPRSKKKKLHPKQLVYSESMAGEGTGGAVYEKSKKIKKKKQLKTTSPDKNIYEFTEETRPSSSTIKSTIKTKKQDKKKMSKRKRFLSREIEEQGTWVQCTADRCGKWRYLSEVTDPATVPDRWTCSMNKDEEYNSCEKTEADWSELEFVDTCYVEGSIVWAKMPGYPWWPGMVEEDPDDQAYYETDSRQKPIRYHVVFFGKTVSRAWIPERSVRPFTRQDDSDHLGSLVVDGKNYRKRVHVACTMARQAVVLSIKKRLQTFGFGNRFQGHWGKQEVSSDENEKESLKETTSKISPEEETQPTSPDDLSDSGSVEELMEQAEKVLGNAESFLTSLQNKGEDNDGKSDEEFEYSPGKVMKISHKPPVLKKDKEQSEEPKPVKKRKGKKSDDNQIPKKKKKTLLSEDGSKKSKTSLKDKRVSQEGAEVKKAPAFKVKLKKSKPVAPQKENKLSTNDKEVTENTDTEMKPKNEDKQAAPAPKPKKPSFKPPRQKKTLTATASPNDTSENKATEPPPECEPPIPFDSEIFTMEMDSKEESYNKQPKTVDMLPTKTTKKAEKKANPDQEAQKNDSDDMPPCSLEASNTDDADDLHSAPNSPSMDLPDPASTESVCPSSPEMDQALMDSCVPSSPAMDFEECLDDSNVPGSPLMDFDDDDTSCLPVHGTEDPFSDNSQPFDLEE